MSSHQVNNSEKCEFFLLKKKGEKNPQCSCLHQSY